MHTQLVTLHVVGVSGPAAPVIAARMWLDGIRLRRRGDLTFAKVLGTGDGRSFSLRDANPRRWAFLGVWRDRPALEAFERSRSAAGWRRSAREWCRFDLRPLRAKGSWGGRQPFTVGVRAGAGPETTAGAVAAITRARLRPSTMFAFWRAVPPVAVGANAHPGLRFALGVGEHPFGLQGTFSVWDDAAALREFAYATPAHRAVVRRTHTDRWYTEDLFARFAVLSAVGTVDGYNPLSKGCEAHA